MESQKLNDLEGRSSFEDAPFAQEEEDKAVAKIRKSRWKPGDDPWAKTYKGTDPSWSTTRNRLWQNEAVNPRPSRDYSEENIQRMASKKPPTRYNPSKGDDEVMERSHEPAGSRNVVPRWPQEHADVDPQRRPGY